MLKDKEICASRDKDGGSFRDDEIYKVSACLASVSDEDIAGCVMPDINY